MKNNLNMIDLTESTLLVSTRFSQWSAAKTDSSKSTDYCNKNGLAEKSARVALDLLGGKQNTFYGQYKKIKDIVTDARQYWKMQTLPWSNDGARMLLAVNHEQFFRTMRRKKAEFEKAVQDFCEVWPDAMQEAQELLTNHQTGETHFNSRFYPENVDELRRRYDWDLPIGQVNTARDFRCKLIADEVNQIKQNIEKENQHLTKQAMRDVFHRLSDEVKNVKNAIDRAGDKKSRFSDNLVDNLKGFVDLIPNLNLTDDDDLKKLAIEVKRELTGSTLKDESKRDVKKREQNSQKAKQVLDKIESKMAMMA